jgi:hypothetical protein
MVAGMLGHSSPSIVSTYAKVADDFRRRGIQKPKELRNASELPPPWLTCEAVLLEAFYLLPPR